jgi:hypothetical protein
MGIAIMGGGMGISMAMRAVERAGRPAGAR